MFDFFEELQDFFNALVQFFNARFGMVHEFFDKFADTEMFGFFKDYLEMFPQPVSWAIAIVIFSLFLGGGRH